MLILAALAGFTLGSGGALLLELTERRIRNEEEAVSLYPLPVLARIPILKGSQLRGRQASGWHMLPAVREAFRTLMIQLGPNPEGRAHVVMVTSASTGDGKTTSAVNLAAAAAASGDPVILLDFDLRKPDVGRTLGVQAGTELTRAAPARDAASRPALPRSRTARAVGARPRASPRATWPWSRRSAAGCRS